MPFAHALDLKMHLGGEPAFRASQRLLCSTLVRAYWLQACLLTPERAGARTIVLIAQVLNRGILGGRLVMAGVPEVAATPLVAAIDRTGWRQKNFAERLDIALRAFKKGVRADE